MDAKNFQPASTAPPNGENSNQVTQFEKPPPSYDQVIMNQNNKTNQPQIGTVQLGSIKQQPFLDTVQKQPSIDNAQPFVDNVQPFVDSVQPFIDTLQQQVFNQQESSQTGNIGPFRALKKALNKQCFIEQEQPHIIDAFEPEVIYLPEVSQTTKIGPYRTLKKAFNKQCYCTNKQLIRTCVIIWPVLFVTLLPLIYHLVTT